METGIVSSLKISLRNRHSYRYSDTLGLETSELILNCMTTSSGQSVGSRDHRAEATSDTLSVRRRDPDQVMRLERLGSSHQSRLSFMRILLRRINAEGWQFTRPQFDIDEASGGTTVYSVRTPTRSYSLVAFSH